MIMLAKSALCNISAVTFLCRLYCGYRVINFTTREQRQKEADSSIKRVYFFPALKINCELISDICIFWRFFSMLLLIPEI